MPEIIDCYSHIMPQSVRKSLLDANPTATIEAHDDPIFYDIDRRLADMDAAGIDKQVLTLASPPSWLGMDPEAALPIVKQANDEISRLGDRYPDRFVPVGTLPFLSGAYLDELDRCLTDLGMAGIQIFSNVDGKPLDAEEFLPFYDAVESLDVPLWMHPQLSEYGITGDSMFYDKVFGWLFDTTVALSRLVFSGIMDRHPELHVIAHHMCAMVPHFADRIRTFYEAREFYPHTDWAPLSRPTESYFKQFYGDTVVNGSVPALETGCEFLGTDHLLFGSDYPYGPDDGRRWLGDTDSVRQLSLSDDALAGVLGDNLDRLIG